MTIEDEVAVFIYFLSHPAGFDVGCSGMLGIRPTDENSPPRTWEVEWEHELDGYTVKSYRNFESLENAAQFFVEKRRYMVLGLDFEFEMSQESNENEQRITWNRCW